MPDLPLLAAAEQTRLSWARMVESYDEVPEIYKGFFDGLPTSTFPYAVLTPTFKGFLHQESEKLVCSPDHVLYILERAKNDLLCTRYSLEDISYVEVGLILLKAWITIRGIASDGALTSSTLKFNAVTERLFTPMLKKIRTVAGGRTDADLGWELSKFNHLGTLNFKFMNFARRSILPGEEVMCTLLQPEIRATVITLLGRSLFRTISTAHLHILTDRELIMIRDENSDGWSREVRYGGIWTYVPLGKITSVSLTDRGDSLLVLSIHLPENDRLDSLFSTSARREIDFFLDQLESLLPDIPKKSC
jgi:hypothetical protein